MLIKLRPFIQTITVGTAESVLPLEIDARELDVERLDEKDESKDDDNASKLPPIYVSMILEFMTHHGKLFFFRVNPD